MACSAGGDGSTCRFPFESGPCDGLWSRTLGAELAEHRYPDSPRRIPVLRRRREPGRHACRLSGPLRPNRHDNPLTRVSTALPTRPPQSRRNPGIRCTTTLLATSPVFERNLLDSAFLGRPNAPPRIRQSFANSAPRVRSDDHTHETGDVERKGLSTTLQPATDQPGRDRTVIPYPASRVEPSRQSLRNPPARVSPECQQPSNCRSETTSENINTTHRPAAPGRTEQRKWQPRETLMRGLSRMIRT